ncbi:molybdenum cofactor guanylyltransferase MobA [Acidocella sp.]|uniref:molybdenum cofactor guanylyltransferase MobA n=1 Tax=Acidocella sp. TaxID=50710 RepID=UPI00261F928D|nr:molybdenum cofactor guanylyltransferase MobA [Acidocella sp.]
MNPPPGVILAGGQSRRLGGGDKTLLPLGGMAILEHVIRAVRPQTSALLINSNSDPALFAHTGLQLRADTVPGRPGPLAGILTAMLWARENYAAAVLTVPADTPFLPADLVARLAAAFRPDCAAIAASGGRLHPIIGLWPCTQAKALQEHLAQGRYRARAWLDHIGFTEVAFVAGAVDPFWNINTPEELHRARQAAGA